MTKIKSSSLTDPVIALETAIKTWKLVAEKADGLTRQIRLKREVVKDLIEFDTSADSDCAMCLHADLLHQDCHNSICGTLNVWGQPKTGSAMLCMQEGAAFGEMYDCPTRANALKMVAVLEVALGRLLENLKNEV